MAASFTPRGMKARIGIKATFVCKNAAGQVIKTIDASGSVPIAKLGMTEDQARDFVQQQQQEKSDERRE